MKKLSRIISCLTIFTSILLYSCNAGRDSNRDEYPLTDNQKGIFILHDDFGSLVGWARSADLENLQAAARHLATCGADYISLCVSLGEMVNYHPALHGESRGTDRYVSAWGEDHRNIDPYGVVLTELRQQGIPVLAKFRVNDYHHINNKHLRSSFWQENPQWYIGHTEQDTDIVSSFKNHPSIGNNVFNLMSRYRSQVLDYSIAEVREKRLAIFREVIERYDIAGATLNFMRTPYCVSFPEKNAGHLTGFVRQCRRVLDEVFAAKGIGKPILGALLPWDIDFCRAMGMEVDVWIKEGLFDYVSPSDGWVSNFNMDIRPWLDLTEGTRCAVYPGIVGMITHEADFCIPGEYEFQQQDRKGETRAKIMPGHVRALAHRFYAEGADGFSSFNLYAGSYSHLFPLSDLISPDNLNAGERIYAYMRYPEYWTENSARFLQLHLPAEGKESQSIRCLMHESLKDAQAYLRFKARGADDVSDLAVFINGRKIPSQQLQLIPHDGEGFLYIKYTLVPDDIRDGDNEIAFALIKPSKSEVIIQEIEIRVHPLLTDNQALRQPPSACSENSREAALFGPGA